jgi:hypothetical protein
MLTIACLMFGIAALGSAQIVNPGFEDGTDGAPPPGWTVTPYLNNLGFLNATNGIQTFANLQLDNGTGWCCS